MTLTEAHLLTFPAKSIFAVCAPGVGSEGKLCAVKNGLGSIYLPTIFKTKDGTGATALTTIAFVIRAFSKRSMKSAVFVNTATIST
jgi:hypothetical protein